ncbi:MAG TPA: hypothetical protein VEJ63_10055, partial [Planctomycetota bacterium]|nr:hypothetical protein [Planctomycetota bacterium]
VQSWMKSAARGSQERRREAMLHLIRGGDSVVPVLNQGLSDGDHQIVSLAQTLLPIMQGGPVVNGLRLTLDPGRVELSPGQQRIITVNYSNVSDQPVRVVTGASTWGDNVVSAAAWEVRPVSINAEGKTTLGEALPTVLPFGFGQLREGESAPQPLTRVTQAFAQTAIAVSLRVEKVQVDGKDVTRLLFPHGHVDLAAATQYQLRVRFECPGPRADQRRLIDAQYWMGGRLVSNEILLDVK